jgi:hypothetical protein
MPLKQEPNDDVGDYRKTFEVWEADWNWFERPQPPARVWERCSLGWNKQYLREMDYSGREEPWFFSFVAFHLTTHPNRQSGEILVRSPKLGKGLLFLIWVHPW